MCVCVYRKDWVGRVRDVKRDGRANGVMERIRHSIDECNKSVHSFKRDKKNCCNLSSQIETR